MASKIYPNGEKEITVSSGEKLSVYSLSSAKLFVKSGYPNFPESWSLEATSEAGATYTTAAMSADTIYRVEASSSQVLYDTGVVPNVLPAIPGIRTFEQGDPTAETVTATLTIAELLTGVITGTHAAGATQTYTLPTGTLADAGVDLAVDQAFDWTLINLSAAAADTITVAAGTDHAVVGDMVVQSGHATTGGLYGASAQFRTRKTAANTFVTYRIA